MKNSRIKKNLQKVAIKTIAILVFFISIPALSAIPYRTAFESMDIINYETKELNLGLFARIEILVQNNRMDLSNYIPYANLPQNGTGDEIAKRVFSQTLKNFLDSAEAQNIALVQNAAQVQNSLSQEVGSTAHKVKFNFNPLDTTAEVKYKGAFEAQVSYDVSHGHMAFEVSKTVGAQTYAYTHNENQTGTVDQVGVRWSF